MNPASPVQTLSSLTLAGWLKEPRRARELWLGKYSVTIAWLGLLLAMISPAHGWGFSVCLFHSTTGLPCPGCGVTRSLSCAVRGMFLESLNYHPMGLLILGLFLFTALQGLFPAAARRRLSAYFEEHAVLFNSVYVMFVAAFVGFGAMRALVAIARHLF